MVPCRVSCFGKQQTLAFQTLPNTKGLGVDGLLGDHHCHYDDDDDDDVDTARDVLALARCWLLAAGVNRKQV